MFSHNRDTLPIRDPSPCNQSTYRQIGFVFSNCIFRPGLAAPIATPPGKPNAAIKPLNQKLALFFRIHHPPKLCIVPPRTPICQTGESGFGPRLAATPAIS
jgi:hypothetical protein